MTKAPPQVVLIAMGSRGDTQPVVVAAIALVKEAAARGLSMRPTVLAHTHFAAWMQKEHGDVLDVCPFAHDIEEHMNEVGFLSASFEQLGEARKAQGVPFADTFDEILSLCHGADLIVGNFCSWPMVLIIHQLTRIPVGMKLCCPAFRSSIYPFIASSARTYEEESANEEHRRQANMTAHNASVIAGWKSASEFINGQLSRFGLPVYDSAEAYRKDLDSFPMFCMFSELIVPRDPIWPSWFNMGGFLFPELDQLPPLSPDLDTFLARDEDHPPVYLGFGSMPVANHGRLFPLVKELLEATPSDIRFVVYVGGMHPAQSKVTDADRSTLADQLLQDYPNRMHLVKSEPHLLLFPKCSAIIHHCGAGTTAAAAWSGRPSVPCPVNLDQPFWAYRLYRLGVASKPVPFSSATGTNLAAAIAEALQPECVTRAEQVGKKVRAEKGNENFANWCLSLLADGKGKHQ